MIRPVILFLAASPVHTSVRALDRECAAIERELARTPGREDLAFHSRWAVTVDGLMQHLLELQPAILHFCGHGDARGLLLEDDDGRPQPVAPAALTRMIKAAARSVQVVVLNACYSDAQAEALRDVVGCAIGMTGVVSDEAARAFAVGFYRALGHRRSVGNAYDHAVATLEGKGLATQAEPRCLAHPGVDVETLAVRAEAPPARSRPARAAAARYDLFLAYPAVDQPDATALYHLLEPDVVVFLDARSLRPGDRWDREVPAAQRASRATVILLSSHADQGWYLGHEIASAIALHRAAPAAHALVPVRLEPGAAMPYGLTHVQAIDAVAEGGLAGIAARLRELAARLRARDTALPEASW